MCKNARSTRITECYDYYTHVGIYRHLANWLKSCDLPHLLHCHASHCLSLFCAGCDNIVHKGRVALNSSVLFADGLHETNDGICYNCLEATHVEPVRSSVSFRLRRGLLLERAQVYKRTYPSHSLANTDSASPFAAAPIRIKLETCADTRDVSEYTNGKQQQRSDSLPLDVILGRTSQDLPCPFLLWLFSSG